MDVLSDHTAETARGRAVDQAALRVASMALAAVRHRLTDAEAAGLFAQAHAAAGEALRACPGPRSSGEGGAASHGAEGRR